MTTISYANLVYVFMTVHVVVRKFKHVVCLLSPIKLLNNIGVRATVFVILK